MRILLLSLFAGFVLSSTAHAVTIEVGNHQLRPNQSQQRIPIIAFAEGNDPSIVGFNLVGQLGDGIGGADEPVFHGQPDTLEGVDFSGGIWDEHSATASGMAPVRDNMQFATASVTFTNTGDAVQPNGLIATLLVDTTGFSSGDFALKLMGTQANDSRLILPGGEEMLPVVFNGMISIVPEPTSAVLASSAIVLIALGIRRRR